MSKFANAFSNIKSETSQSDSGIDWEVVNKQRNEIFGTQDKAKPRVGIISGIIDLGVQQIEPGHSKSDVPLEEEAAYIEANPTNWFDDVENPQNKTIERHKFWPQKPQRAVAFTVDFPQYKFDWGGDIGVKPFRFLLNGEFIPKGKSRKDIILGRIYDLKETTKDFAPKWSLSKKSVPYKLALATDTIKQDEPFTKDRLGELIGKAALFEVRFWLNDRGYAEEKIIFKSEVPEGMEIPKIDEDLLFYVNMSTENDEAVVKTLRKAVYNTILMSESYPGSKLQEQFGHIVEGREKGDSSIRAGSPADAVLAKTSPTTKATSQTISSATPAEDFDDDDIPF